MPDFVHQFVPPKNSTLTVLLLHGTGGDENDLVPIGRAVAPGAALLSPRGQVDENGMHRFFRRISLGVFDEDDVRRRAADLADFVKQAAERYSFDPARVVALGYSNGANIAAAMLLLHPGALAGAVLMRPMVPLVPDPLPPLNGKPVLILAGEADHTTTRDNTDRLARVLSVAGADVEVRWQEGGHELDPRDFQATAEFLKSKL